MLRGLSHLVWQGISYIQCCSSSYQTPDNVTYPLILTEYLDLNMQKKAITITNAELFLISTVKISMSSYNLYYIFRNALIQSAALFCVRLPMITWRERRTTSEPKEIERRILQLSKLHRGEVKTSCYSLAHRVTIPFFLSRASLNAAVFLSHTDPIHSTFLCLICSSIYFILCWFLYFPSFCGFKYSKRHYNYIYVR